MPLPEQLLSEQLLPEYEGSQTLAADVYDSPLLLPPHYAEQLAVQTQKRSVDYEGRYGYNDFKTTTDGIAIIKVKGMLLSRGRYWNMTTYADLRSQLREAEKDETVRGILLDVNSPGGMVDNVDDTARLIREISRTKPVWAMAYNQMTSGAYWLASACNRIIATSSAKVGSIGVLVVHADYSKNFEQMGVNITLIHAGSRKTEGNIYEPLPEAVRSRIQTSVDETYDLFTQRIAEYRGLTQQAVKNTEAGIFTAGQAITHNLVDEVMPADDVLQKFSQSLLTVGTTLTVNSPEGATIMTQETKAPAVKDPAEQSQQQTVETPEAPQPEAPQKADAAELLELCEGKQFGFMASSLIKSGATMEQATAELAEAGKIRDVLTAAGLEDKTETIIKDCGHAEGVHKAGSGPELLYRVNIDPKLNFINQ
ncbi:signal peptide peptidase SppA [Endozoicomonas montiporae]|uniref:signal peptide peptidase SppA n=1 Tax=Endozoicomonas montiporae TaxID=1027273 RepID=UPI00068A773E|nr:signal peptide peptidase SppA [Endozoicomonas montiporae]